jgi:hypothetical protein
VQAGLRPVRLLHELRRLLLTPAELATERAVFADGCKREWNLACRKRDILGHVEHDGDPAGVFEAMILQGSATIL